jgi:hypothetical protein
VELALDEAGDFLSPTEPSIKPPVPPGPVPQPSAFQVPLFSHGPPPTIQGCRRWPTAPELHALASTAIPTLHDILALLLPFLDSPAKLAISHLSTTYTYGIIGAPLAFTRPWSPYRRRRWGFGIPSKHRSATHDHPSTIGMIHHIWPFLTPADRWSSYQACTSWRSYIRLRVTACRTLVAPLRATKPPLSASPPKRLNHDRARLYANALLRFNFV